jgi:hypothetical protein
MNPENGLNVKKEIWGLSRIKKKKRRSGAFRATGKPTHINPDWNDRGNVKQKTQ